LLPFAMAHEYEGIKRINKGFLISQKYFSKL